LLSTGEVSDVWAVGTSLCSLLSSCDRAGDVERAIESIRVAETLLLQPLDGRPKVMSTHCKIAFGSVLCSAGRWPEGEAALLEALGPDASCAFGHRVEASSRLAELRLHQGRVDDAAALLADLDDYVNAAGPLAMLHLRRGDADLAAAVLRGAIKRMVNDVLRGGPLTALLVEAELTRGDIDAARDAVSLLGSMAAAVETPLISALETIAAARVALATGDRASAVSGYEAALDQLGDGQHPLLVATVHLELAGALDEPGAAIASARAAHAAAQRMNATVLSDKAAAMKRSLGATPPRSAKPSEALAGLTARELDVLAGIQRGDSNAEIAAALFLSPKTVEHHVGRILGKLGVRTRAEAAAVAARGRN
jgi:DNA-binding NarL/FixJ family response regulator